MQASGNFTQFKGLTKTALRNMTNNMIRDMGREKLIEQIESARRCCTCLTATKRNRGRGIKTYKVDISTDFGKHVCAMSLDCLGMFPYENETARSNRFRPKDSGVVAEFKICKICYDRFQKKFSNLLFNEETCTLYRFLADIGDEHQRKPPSPPGF